jgi:predicted P-loop ATPase
MDDALRDLELAKIVLAVARHNNYKSIIIDFLENAVKKAQAEYDSFKKPLTAEWLTEFFAPREVVKSYPSIGHIFRI